MAIVITACGAVSTLARDWPGTWRRLLRADRCDLEPGDWAREQKLAARVAEISAVDRSPDANGASSAARLALLAAQEATADLPPTARTAIYGGTTHGEYDVVQALCSMPPTESAAPQAAGWNRALIFDSIPRYLVKALHTRAEIRSWVYSACTSSLHALALAVIDQQLGVNDDSECLVVGVDSLSRLELCGFLTAGAVAKGDCLPFHEQRDGILIGEGAAALRLAKLERDPAPGMVSILGVGMSCDAGHAMEPDPNGRGIADAAGRALGRAGVRPEDVAGIVLHGTGTVKNDAAELAALRKLFGTHLPPCTTIKGLIGHTMGAAGIFNALVAMQACRERTLPPACTWHSGLLPGMDLVVDEARRIEDGPVLACSSGFGGNNCAAVFHAAG